MVVPGFHTHDGALFRAQMGGGPLNVEGDAGGETLTLKGAGVGLNIAVGGALNPSLVLFGEVAVHVVSDPDVEVGGLSGQASGNSTFGGLGAGMAYYFPGNTFVGATLMMNNLTSDDGDPDTDDEEATDYGAGLKLQAGHEWWVSADWGLGVAAQVWAGATSEDVLGTTIDYTATSFALLFSATYN